MRTSRYAGKLAALREERGGRCVWPGDHEGQLEFAHLPGKATGLSGRGRGRSDRYHDVRRHPEAYVLLCVRHHVELDGRGGLGMVYNRKVSSEGKPWS